jgi:acetyltransferase-like isoleucine patch superfamily enzyme
MPKLSPDTPFVHDGARVVNSTFGRYCEVGESARVINSSFEDYAYCDRMADISNTTVGRFSNIAAMTRIGPTDHPYENAAQHHFLYRSSYYWDDAADDPAFFAARAARRTTLGADCWIGHGAIIKRTRFSPVVIDRLLALAWWDWDHARLRAALNDFRSLKAEAFLEKYNG